MTPTPGAAAECRVCQKPGARNGRLPNKYCNETSCMQVGIDEGHIAHAGKRQKAQSPAACSSPVSMPDTWQLLEIKGIFDCRCTRPAPCRIPPDTNRKRSSLSPRLHYASSTARITLPRRTGSSRRRRWSRAWSTSSWATSSARRGTSTASGQWRGYRPPISLARPPCLQAGGKRKAGSSSRR